LVIRHRAEIWDVYSLRVLGVSCIVVLQATTTVAQAPLQRVQMPTLPLTQLDERGLAADLDNRTFSLTFAQPVPIQDLLLLLVHKTNLSVVSDPAATGSFIGELKNVTVRQALGLILRPLGLDYTVDASCIRVFKREPETRLFDLNYIAIERTGSSSAGGDGGLGSSATVTSTSRTDVFEDLTKGVQTLLTERAAFNVDRKAGLLQVTDFPERLDRISLYLEAVQDRVHRQVQIDARIIEIEPTDEKAPGVDWVAVAVQMAAADPATPRVAARPVLAGLRVTDVAKLMTALEAQGKVTVLASPRLLTLNNEPSIVRTETVTFIVTPQIAPDSVLTLSLTPMLNAPAAIEADMLARVNDGETLVISGFTQDREVRERKNVGTSGGWFGRGTVVTKRRVELVILLTPRIVAGVSAQ
jgi:type II secretory pathway component GspD/PulD (secretin)